MINITADSRKVKKGDIFVAIGGFQHDGHDFIEKAIENGASKIVAERGSYSIPYEIVENSRAYLVDYLAKEYNPQLKDIKIIGITGTNGKTTTAFLLYQALRLLGKKAAYIGTIGFYLDKKVMSLSNTCPDIWDLYDLFMQAKDASCEYIIQEVSSHALAYPRIEGYLFDYALFTNLTQDHLDYHKTMENYALAKQILFQKLKKDGKAFINVDDPYKDYFLLSKNHNITYGFKESDYQIISYDMNHLGSKFSYCHDGKSSSIHMKLIGRYNVYNAMGMIAILREMGFSSYDVEKILPSLEAPIGRMDMLKYKNNTIIIDYAHTPDAIENIIKTVEEVLVGSMYVVFGCTGGRDRLKRPIMFQIASSHAKKVIITNDDPHYEDPNQIVSDILRDAKFSNYEVCLDRKKAIQKGISLLKENDVLLILGKGHEEFMIIGDDKIPFCDKKVVLDYLDTTLSKGGCDI